MEHGQSRACSFSFVRLYVNSWDRGKNKNVVAYILSFPSVSAVLLVLLLLCLLFLTQMFTDGASFRFLMKYISNIPLAVVYQQWIVLIPISRLHAVNRRTLHYRTQGKPCVL